MQPKRIFYSWQSDLPSGSNRSLIENALKTVLEDRKKESIHLDESVDRDTLNTSGSPDIVQTVFSKIDNCSVFVADITPINLASEHRRTPNPNVLLELGYAIKAIGWNNIILVFNEAYGDVIQLPFDLRQHRIFKYKLKSGETKLPEQKKLSGDLAGIIGQMLASQVPSDKIRLNIKMQVDHEIYKIGNQLRKILHGYKDWISPDDVMELIYQFDAGSLTLVRESKPIGFQLLKSWKHYAVNLSNIKNNIVYSKYIDDEKIASLIELIDALKIFSDNFEEMRFYQPLRVKGKLVQTSAYRISRTETRNLNLISISSSEVVDQGKFTENDSELLVQYHLKMDEALVYQMCLSELLTAMEKVVDSWGGSLIINPANLIV